MLIKNDIIRNSIFISVTLFILFSTLFVVSLYISQDINVNNDIITFMLRSFVWIMLVLSTMKRGSPILEYIIQGMIPVVITVLYFTLFKKILTSQEYIFISMTIMIDLLLFNLLAYNITTNRIYETFNERLRRKYGK